MTGGAGHHRLWPGFLLTPPRRLDDNGRLAVAYFKKAPSFRCHDELTYIEERHFRSMRRADRYAMPMLKGLARHADARHAIAPRCHAFRWSTHASLAGEYLPGIYHILPRRFSRLHAFSPSTLSAATREKRVLAGTSHISAFHNSLYAGKRAISTSSSQYSAIVVALPALAIITLRRKIYYLTRGAISPRDNIEIDKFRCDILLLRLLPTIGAIFRAS